VGNERRRKKLSLEKQPKKKKVGGGETLICPGTRLGLGLSQGGGEREERRKKTKRQEITKINWDFCSFVQKGKRVGGGTGIGERPHTNEGGKKRGKGDGGNS